MPRLAWDDLPSAVRVAVEAKSGAVMAATPMAGGALSPVALRLDTRNGGRIALKGTPADHPKAWMHRNETTAARMTGLAPALLWHIESDGWLVLAFEFIDGHPADMSPGSVDLPHVADAVRRLAKQGTPCPGRWLSLAERWAGVGGWTVLAADPPDDLDPWIRDHLPLLAAREADSDAALGGDTLVHTDLCPDNILIARGPYVIDWAWPGRGPAWVDTAMLITRLIRAGHRPADAEAWAQTVPAWADADPDVVTDFAVRLAGVREQWQRTHPAPHMAELAAATTDWARARLGGQ